jgi:alpha-D-ribose 1-methylphosphonate 5-triphosphate synthase subunit PhnL
MLKIKAMSKEFTMHARGGVRIPSFSGVSVEVGGGRLLAVTGPSGIGKSSLLKCVYRTYTPSGGRAEYLSASGKTIDLAAADDWDMLALRRDEIGYISQFFHVMPRVTALEILTEPLMSAAEPPRSQIASVPRSRAATRGKTAAEAEEIARTMLSRAGLGRALWDMYPATFSGGEKQRLNILRAIITKPRLLLLDEPTASLDPGYKNRVIEMLLELKAEGAAMLGVFHDRDALLALSDGRYDMSLREYCDIEDKAVAPQGRPGVARNCDPISSGGTAE